MGLELMQMIAQGKKLSDRSSENKYVEKKLVEPWDYDASEYKSLFMPKDYNYVPTDEDKVGTGGQTTRRLLTSSLQEAQRRARLSGRSLSEAETEGITRGFFGQAGERLTQKRGLALQKRGQDISAGLAYAGLSSAERMKKGQLDLVAAGLTAADKAKAADVRLAQQGLNVQLETGRMAGATARETSGLFGQGGILGLGIGSGDTACIIITACTHPNSYEVDVARVYRDFLLDAQTLSGYYALCCVVVPLIRKFNWFKRLMKNLLVNRLIDYGEWVIQITDKPRLCTTKKIARGFLKVCSVVGKFVDKESWLAKHRG